MRDRGHPQTPSQPAFPRSTVPVFQQSIALAPLSSLHFVKCPGVVVVLSTRLRACARLCHPTYTTSCPSKILMCTTAPFYLHSSLHNTRHVACLPRKLDWVQCIALAQFLNSSLFLMVSPVLHALPASSTVIVAFLLFQE